MCLCALVKRKRTKELNNRVEAFLLTRSTTQCLVTTDAQYRGELTGVSTNHILIHIPGLYAQRLTLIHCGPRLWCLECGNIQ